MDNAQPAPPLPPKGSLAEIPPCPYVRDDAPPGPNFSASLLLFGAAGAGALFLLSATMTPTMGATRSARLKWQDRLLQIEQAEQEATACPEE
jgi:hypothetical protein